MPVRVNRICIVVEIRNERRKANTASVRKKKGVLGIEKDVVRCLHKLKGKHVAILCW